MGKISIRGYVGQDCLKVDTTMTTKNGTTYTAYKNIIDVKDGYLFKNTLAMSCGKDKNGKSNYVYLNLVMFDSKLQKFWFNNVKKQNYIEVFGLFTFNVYTDKTGNKVEQPQIIVDAVKVMPPKKQTQ